MKVKAKNSPLRSWVTVCLDGIDVTNQCFMADEESGEVGLYVLDADGKHYVANDDVAKETLRGKVLVSLKPDAPHHIRKYFEDIHARSNHYPR